MKCIHCKGEMKRAAAPFHIDRKGYHMISHHGFFNRKERHKCTRLATLFCFFLSARGASIAPVAVYKSPINTE